MEFFEKWQKRLDKEWKKPPKVSVFSHDPRDDERAELMQKLLEHMWAENWPYVKADLEQRMRIMIQKCYMVGQHDWIGYGEKDRHMCRRCGLKANVIYDPIFDGAIEILSR